MHITIERKERTVGLFKQTTKYDVTVAVTFSEEEKAVIKKMKLDKLAAHWVWEGKLHGRDHGIDVRSLLSSPYTWHADTIGLAEAWEQEMRAGLKLLKSRLDINAQPAKKSDTFEL